MSTHVPPGWHSVTSRLVCQDPAKLVGFLKDAFAATAEYRDDVPTLVTIGDSIVMVSETGARKATPSFLYLYVRDADETYRRALERGAASVEQPWNTPYGDRRAMVTDPWGNDWQIATYRGPKR